jgi:protein KTI12
MSKANKTTQCTVHCEATVSTAWERNNLREKEDDRYTQETFDALTMRFEAPDSRNRWDSPLFTVMPGDTVPFEQMHSVLFERKAPPPNQSTQCVSNALYILCSDLSVNHTIACLIHYRCQHWLTVSEYVTRRVQSLF